MREKFGEKVRLTLVCERTGWLRRRLGLPSVAAGRSGPGLDGFPERLLGAVEDRLMWSRYGL